jgi:ABC-type proline/glycine betaine transport system ATPase subunit
MTEAIHFGDTVVLMNEGRIEQVGTGADLMTRPANDFAARFVRSQRREIGVPEAAS